MNDIPADQAAPAPPIEPPRPAPPAPVPLGEASLPYPPDGQSALLYSGTETITRGGVTFAPDSIQVVPDAVAATLIGTDNIRVIAETVDTWPHFLAIRARVKASAAP